MIKRYKLAYIKDIIDSEIEMIKNNIQDSNSLYDFYVNTLCSLKYTTAYKTKEKLEDKAWLIKRDIQAIKNNKSFYIVHDGGPTELIAKQLDYYDLRDYHFEQYKIVRICNNKLEVMALYKHLKRKNKNLELFIFEQEYPD